MGEDIRDLIDKINEEGIKAAEKKARDIEGRAQQRADEILDRARRDADELIAAARERIRCEDEKERALLAQAARDMLLSLRKEINAMLGRIVVSDIQQALNPDVVARILTDIVRNQSAGKNQDITVVLGKEDLEILEQNYIDKIGKETEKTIVVRPSDETAAGFAISYDRGRSFYDFTDKALADYICTYLKPKLNRILNEALEE